MGEPISDERVRECAEWVPGPSHSVPAPDWRDARALAREVLALRKERAAAVAMCREYIELLESGDCGNGPKYANDAAARLAQIGGKDGPD